MRKTLITALALLAIAGVSAAGAAAIGAGGTNSTKQRVRIEAVGDGSAVIPAVLRPITQGRHRTDQGTLTFCCWSESSVMRAGSKLLVTNPLLTFTLADGTLKIRNRIEWVDVPGGLSVQTGTWKVVGGTQAYAGQTGHGRVASVFSNTDGHIKLRLFGWLEG